MSDKTSTHKISTLLFCLQELSIQQLHVHLEFVLVTSKYFEM